MKSAARPDLLSLLFKCSPMCHPVHLFRCLYRCQLRLSIIPPLHVPPRPPQAAGCDCHERAQRMGAIIWEEWQRSHHEHAVRLARVRPQLRLRLREQSLSAWRASRTFSSLRMLLSEASDGLVRALGSGIRSIPLSIIKLDHQKVDRDSAANGGVLNIHLSGHTCKTRHVL